MVRWAVQKLADPGASDSVDLDIKFLTMGKDGYLYYARGAELYRHTHPKTLA